MRTLPRWIAAWICIGMLAGPACLGWADSPAASPSPPSSAAAEHLDLTYYPR